MKIIYCFFIGLLIDRAASAQTFTLKSADLGGQFTNTFAANTFGCSGDNKSPELSWINAPAGTQSFAITMYDADAPTGSGFWHWVVVDIPANITELKQGAGDVKTHIAPEGCLQTISDTGLPGYQGPCPGVNEGDHRYLITVYALKTAKLGTNVNSTAAIIGFMLGKQLIAKASLVVYYRR